MSEVYDRHQEQVFSLSPEELDCFGWSASDGLPPVHGVCAVRGPDGRRCIPTRQKMSTGEIIYGSIETMEPPPNISDDEWEERFGSWDRPFSGRLM